ncbi:MAG: proteasome endopeptidase complex, archaeal, alpha subunit [Desulfurococcales archaeon ex4484_58]|nr:MAG: proteasome endopeptidase complex, archaeal, alpha subunit [Desulfurococcales archaeon ex4484_58]
MGFGLPAATAYDRAITIFAPDGRIYQVEYAFESVRRGWTTLGIKSRGGAVVVVHKKKQSPLVDEKIVQKIFRVDEHIGASFAGIASDGRVLVDQARHLALLHRFYYDEPILVEYLAKQVCDIKQAYTQHAGVRPFGVAIIFVGVDDNGPQLYMTEPSGRYLSYYAVAIGEKSGDATSFLEKNYNYELSLPEIIKLGIQTIANIAEEKITPQSIEAGYISVDEKKFKIMSIDEIKKYIDELIKEGKIK